MISLRCRCGFVQEARGVQMTMHTWRDSAHCEHFRVHPEEYTERLQGFLSGLRRD